MSGFCWPKVLLLNWNRFWEMNVRMKASWASIYHLYCILNCWDSMVVLASIYAYWLVRALCYCEMSECILLCHWRKKVWGRLWMYPLFSSKKSTIVGLVDFFQLLSSLQVVKSWFLIICWNRCFPPLFIGVSMNWTSFRLLELGLNNGCYSLFWNIMLCKHILVMCLTRAFL